MDRLDAEEPIHITLPMNKLISYTEAAAKVKDGMTLMIGGFLGHGTPEGIIDELVKAGAKDLTIIVNDTSFPDKGCGRLIANGQVARVITSHIGTNPSSLQQMLGGTLQVEFCPQGSLAERIRCGGSGLGGVLTATGLGTEVAQGKQIIAVNGKEYLLETPLRADVALIHASLGDENGNLVYRGTMQNFNPVMAMAADTVIAQIDEIVPVGEINPEQVHTPHIFVDYMTQNP